MRIKRAVTLLCILCLPALVHADTTPRIFHTEQAYLDEIQRLRSEIDRIRNDARDEDALVGQATFQLLERERLRNDLQNRVRRLELETANLEGGFETRNPDLQRAIRAVRAQRDQWEAKLGSDPSAVTQYDFYNARLEELQAALAANPQAQADTAALEAKRQELATTKEELDTCAKEVARWQRELALAQARLDAVLKPTHELEQQLAALRSQAPLALAGVQPPVLLSIDAGGYTAEWVGKERTDRDALTRLEAQMLVAERLLAGTRRDLVAIDSGMRREERELVASTQRYVALTDRMATTAWVDALLRTTIEAGDAIGDTVKSSGGNPTGILINSAIEIGTRYDSFIMGYNYLTGQPLGENAPSQRMAVASQALLEERHRHAGNAVIEAYQFYGLPVPKLPDAAGMPVLPPPSSVSGVVSSVAGFVYDFTVNTDRVKDSLKANVQDTVSDIAERMVETGIAGSIRGSDVGGWRRVLQFVPSDASELTTRIVQGANPHFSQAMVQNFASMIRQTARESIAWETIRERFGTAFRDAWQKQGFRNKLRELASNPNALKSIGEEALINVTQAAIDSLEDQIRDGIMSDMVAEEIVWLQIRRRYHFLGAHKQVLEGAAVATEELLNELRAEYARIAMRDGGRTLVIGKDDVFRPGEHSARLRFSVPVLNPRIESDTLAIVGDPVLERDRHFVTFRFRVPEAAPNGPITAALRISASGDRTEKPVDGDPSTLPYFDSGAMQWRLYDAAPDATHRIRLVNTAPGTSVSILLDDSASMHGDRFPKAQAGIKQLLARLKQRGLSLEVALWTFSGGASPVVGFTGDLAAVEAAVDQARPTAGTPLARTIDAAGAHLFTGSRYRGRILYIFSDGKDSEGGDPAAAIDRLRRRAMLAEKSGW